MVPLLCMSVPCLPSSEVVLRIQYSSHSSAGRGFKVNVLHSSHTRPHAWGRHDIPPPLGEPRGVYTRLIR